MAQGQTRIAFVLASTCHGTMILNRFDYRPMEPDRAYGVGFQLLDRSSYQPGEIALVTTLLDRRRRHFGDGVSVLDIGANIGVFTVAWAKHMTGWGQVLAIEAQERIYYALAGNIAVNNCFNARATCAAVTNRCGVMRVPVPNYLVPGSFGSLELRQSEQNEYIGQPVEYNEDRMTDVNAMSVDSLAMSRLDLMKVDVERMELEVLEGAREAINRHHPILLVENLKTDRAALRSCLDSFGYKYFVSGMNFVAIHPTDPCIEIGRDNPPPAA
ncbi:MAG TPA: FkbM family methyltransferase [Acetobacteraceae bacterium]|nr:FkbM family methyltransferase [Acetobacteraceae bacterium]